MKKALNLALALAAIATGACKQKSTFVHVTLSPAATEPSGIKSVELDLTLGSQTATTTLREASGADISFPTDATLQIGAGGGQLSIVAIARAADGRELDRGVSSVTVAAAAITQADVPLAGGKADLEPSEPSHSFGQVPAGQSSSVNLSFINAGYKTTGTLATVLAGPGASSFTVTADTCVGRVVAPSQTCSVSIAFQPAAEGSFAATIAVSGTPGGTATESITGIGGANPLGPKLLTVTTSGSGTGVVVSDNKSIACGNTCSASFAYNTVVTLTAQPGANSTVAGWGGACNNIMGPTCQVTMSSAQTVSVVFAAAAPVPQYNLSLPTAGSGAGSVSVSPAGTSCGNGCFTFDANTSVTLTAQARSGNRFAGFSNACGNTNPCTFTLSGNTTVTSTFVATWPVTVQRPTVSGGTVTSSDGVINCSAAAGSVCATSVDAGGSLQLTAGTDSNTRFTGWTGGCTISGSSCAFSNVTAAQSATAGFTTIYPVTVTVSGNGSGTVTSSPAGISCPGTSCSSTFDANSNVTLTIAAASGSRVTFSGACSGSGAPGTSSTCAVSSLSAAQSLSVTFTATYPVSVTRVGPFGPAGSVTTPDGTTYSCTSASCPAASFNADAGSSVTLRARPGNGASLVFTGWSGVTCSGGPIQHDCTFPVNGQVSVTANFTNQNYNTVFVSSVAYPTTLGGARAYDAKCNDLATKAQINNSAGNAFVALMSDDSSDAITQLSGARGFARIDGSQLADLPADLLTKPYYPIDLDETGASQLASQRNTYVMTGSTTAGTNYKDSTGASFNCANWTAAGSNSGVELGEATAGPNWVAWTPASAYCANPERIMCVEKDLNAPLTVNKASGQFIFVSPAFTLTNGGYPALSSVCQNAPNKPGPSNAVYQALVSTTTVPASNYLSPTATYVTPTGQVIGTGAEIAAGQAQWHTGVWEDGSGAFLPNNVTSYIWTGAPSPGSLGTVASTCGDWKDLSQTHGGIGWAIILSNAFRAYFDQPCTTGTAGTSARVYCVQQ